MPFFALYLIKLSICLAAVWLFYQLLLRRLTFYNWNRWYLLGYSFLSFLIPLIDIKDIVGGDSLTEPVVIRYIPVLENYSPAIPAAPVLAGHQASPVSGWALLFILLSLGVVILLGNLAVRWFSLLRLRRNATLIRETAAGMQIYQVDDPVVPFSFGNAVYINPRLHSEKEWEEIILHEFVHIRQRHTADIVAAELLCALNWYNPSAWLIRSSIRQNLEFIADEKVLQNGVDRKGYQYHLLKVIGQPAYHLANNFNFSSLKKRIVMMNRLKSTRLHLIKFLFVLPLLATLLLAFRGQYKDLFKHGGPLFVNAAGIIVDPNTYQPLAGVSVTDKRTGLATVTDQTGFYKLHLPATEDSIRIRLSLTKKGFDNNWIEYFIPGLKESRGCIEIGYLLKQGEQPSFFMFMGFDGNARPPLDPTYADAASALQKVRSRMKGFDHYMKMQQAHPEVSLFYTAEDHQKQIVFYTDGHYEKYGYPGGPTVADMVAKFGTLPESITGKEGSAGGFYVEQWAKISARLEREFHSPNPNVRHIVFPGDSRVIVVPISGKPRIYDMDNSRDDKERPAFEREYGKLPSFVPDPGMQERVRTDTVPQNTDASKDGPVKPQPLLRALQMGRDSLTTGPVYVIDGKMTPDSGIKNINPNQIYAIAVYKGHGDSLSGIYGEQARNGVILITTKQHAPTPDDILSYRARPITARSAFVGTVNITGTGDKPVPSLIARDDKYFYLIDGKPVPEGTDMSKVMNPGHIAGIETSQELGLFRRFGVHDGQTVMNIVTQAHKNERSSFILTYEPDKTAK